MNKIFKKQREVFAILVFIGIIFALAYFVIRPLLLRIDNINNQMQEDAARQENRQKQIAELPKIQQQYQTLQNSEDLSSVLLNKQDAVFLIEKLELLAADTKNEITISVQDAKPVEAPKATASNKGKAETEKNILNDLPNKNYLQMKITLNGSYSAIINFVKSLEKFEYYADIVSLQINKGENQDSRSNSSVSTFDSVNPFSSNEQDVPELTEENTSELKKPITASLDTVFYTRE